LAAAKTKQQRLTCVKQHPYISPREPFEIGGITDRKGRHELVGRRIRAVSLCGVRP
jgi:hypothetical protein